MKQVLLALLFTSSFAFADCITFDSAQKILKEHLEKNGEQDFPQIFEGKSISEKVTLIDDLVKKTETVIYEDYNDLTRISGYSIIVEKYSHPKWDLGVETYLFVSCDGQAEKQEFHQD